jgi:hypothetical protein
MSRLAQGVPIFQTMRRTSVENGFGERALGRVMGRTAGAFVNRRLDSHSWTACLVGYLLQDVSQLLVVRRLSLGLLLDPTQE